MGRLFHVCQGRTVFRRGSRAEQFRVVDAHGPDLWTGSRHAGADFTGVASHTENPCAGQAARGAYIQVGEEGT